MLVHLCQMRCKARSDAMGYSPKALCVHCHDILAYVIPLISQELPLSLALDQRELQNMIRSNAEISTICSLSICCCVAHVRSAKAIHYIQFKYYCYCYLYWTVDIWFCIFFAVI